MQDLLTITAELLVIVPILFLALDFSCGLMHLYSANPTTVQEDKPEEAIAIVPTQGDPNQTVPLNSDPWEGEGEIEVISQCCYKPEAAPVLHLLAPAQKFVEQPAIDYSGWTIRALKKKPRTASYRSIPASPKTN